MSRPLIPSINRTVKQRVPLMQDIQPHRVLVNATPSQETSPVKPKSPMTDLEIFRREGFKTRIEGKGKNFVFIIDKSRSMSEDNRLDGAKQALARTLEKLKSDENYYIYFFSDKTVGMKEGRLLAAIPANINTTGRWVNSMSSGGFTDPRDALVDAFGKQNPSTIWLLSDGKFSSFKRVKRGNGRTRLVGLPSVMKVIRSLTINGNVRINTIGFAARQSDVDASLKDIAEETGGTYKFIRTGEE